MNGQRHPPAVPHPQLVEALARVPYAALVTDGDGMIIYANNPLLKLFGYEADQLIFESLEGLLSGAQRAMHEVQRAEQAALSRRDARARGLRIAGRHSDGSEIPMEFLLQTNDTEFGRLTVAFVSDLRQYQSGRLSLEEVNRALRLVHGCNEILAAAAGERELLAGIANAISKIGAYPQAWIGLLPITGGFRGNTMCVRHGEPAECADDTGADNIALRAIAGEAPLLLSAAELHVLAPNFCPTTSAEAAPAVLALPLVTGEGVHGCLCVTSNAAGSFSTPEIELLRNLAEDLALGLDALHGRRLQRQTQARLRLFERAVEASANGIMITDAQNRAQPIYYVNPAFERMTGYATSEVLGRDAKFLLGDDLAQEALQAIRVALHDRHEARSLLRNYRKDGSLFWNDLTVAPVRDQDGGVTHFVWVMSDATAKSSRDQQFQAHALFDTLTGLPNRHSLFAHIDHAVGAARLAGLTLGVVLVALDRFAMVNEAYGHDAGDMLLREVGARLLGTVRVRDTVGRLGGDEFVVLLTALEADNALIVVEKVRVAMTLPFVLAFGEVMVSASIGVSFAPRDGSDAPSLIRNAEAAMRGAKTAGWNSVRFYAEEMNRRTGERLEMEFDLRRAVERREFEIYYQPIIDIESGRIVEGEALLRWNHPRHGLVLPDAFIPLAEVTGLIVPIGNWVLQEACRQHGAWRGAGLPRIGVAVNLSARQFHEAGLDGLVADALAAHGLVGGDLVLEITESLLMSDIEAAGETLMRLKRLGVHISLDDFGTGYSSLSYLKSLPLDTLKIDRSFVRDISTDPNDAAIASTIISMARTMHLEVIAEGVETPDHLAYLRANNCQRAQGILFSPPVSAANFEKLLIKK